MKQKMRPTQHKRASRTIKCFLAVALALTMLIGLSTTAYAGVTEPKISNSKTYTETENGVAWTFISGKSNQGNALLRLTNIKTFFFIKFFPAKATITEFTVWFKLLGIRILSKSTNTIDYKSAGNRIAADEIAAQGWGSKRKTTIQYQGQYWYQPGSTSNSDEYLMFGKDASGKTLNLTNLKSTNPHRYDVCKEYWEQIDLSNQKFAHVLASAGGELAIGLIATIVTLFFTITIPIGITLLLSEFAGAGIAIKELIDALSAYRKVQRNYDLMLDY